MLKVVYKPHDHKNTRNIISIIHMKGYSDDRVRGTLGDNISDSPGGVMVPGSKALASVDNISGSRGGGWG